MLKEDTDDKRRGVAHGAEDIAVAGEVDGRHMGPQMSKAKL